MKALTRSLALATLAGFLGCSEPSSEPEAAPTPAATKASVGEDEGRRAYATVFQVLTHPRCLNCHPAGQRPLQFDTSQPHAMNVQRGSDDRGRPGLRCTACHSAGNHDQPHLPPGSPDWRLAPLEQAFEGRSPEALAAQLKDPKRSHMSLDELVAHVRDDALVGWGWAPGPERAAVPVSREEFVAAFETWTEAGAPLPKEGAK